MTSPIKELADKQRLTPADIVFQFAKLDMRITTASVHNWFNGVFVPSVEQAEPLAKVLKVSRSKMLDIIHEMKLARKEAAAAGK